MSQTSPDGWCVILIRNSLTEMKSWVAAGHSGLHIFQPLDHPPLSASPLAPERWIYVRGRKECVGGQRGNKRPDTGRPWHQLEINK